MCYSGSISLKPIRNALDVVSGYKSIDAYNTVFKEISPIFYRENYHSDLICYLLKNSEIRETIDGIVLSFNKLSTLK